MSAMFPFCLYNPSLTMLFSCSIVLGEDKQTGESDINTTVLNITWRVFQEILVFFPDLRHLLLVSCSQSLSEIRGYYNPVYPHTPHIIVGLGKFPYITLKIVSMVELNILVDSKILLFRMLSILCAKNS